MSKNYINNIAALLGVRLDEEFEIENFEGVYKFSIHYLMRLDKQGVWKCDNDALGQLLNGASKITKKSWKPEKYEVYYYIDNLGNVDFARYYPEDAEDEGLLKVRVGNFFKSVEEAKANVDKWLKYINQEPDLSWRVK